MRQKKWTLEKLKELFDGFILENGRQPTIIEIDSLDYFPSSRQIQRVYGGLPKLRELLSLEDIHFSKGVNRSKISFDSNSRSRKSEDNLRDILFQKFHEPFVHVEKPIDEKRKLRADFYVYNPTENFAIDVFTTDTYHSLVTNIYIKFKKYSHLKVKFYLVLDSDVIGDREIEKLLRGRKIVTPSNFELISLYSFVEKIQKMIPYDNPLIKE